MTFTPSKKIKNLPRYFFTIINDLKKEAYAKKPDLMLIDSVILLFIILILIDILRQKECQNSELLLANGIKIVLDPETEVLTLIGSKEGLAHLCMSFLDPLDYALTTNPTYPVHLNGIYI